MQSIGSNRVFSKAVQHRIEGVGPVMVCYRTDLGVGVVEEGDPVAVGGAIALTEYIFIGRHVSVVIICMANPLLLGVGLIDRLDKPGLFHGDPTLHSVSWTLSICLGCVKVEPE